MDPTRAQRTGPSLFSLVCVAADSSADTNFDGVSDASFATAAQQADVKQTTVGGNINFMLGEQSEAPDARGPHDTAKLRQGAEVTINVELPQAMQGMSFFADVSSGMVNNHPNPMQVYGTVASIVADPTGAPRAVDVVMSGEYNAQWDAAGVMARSVSPSSPVEAAMIMGASAARAEALSGSFCRAEVPIERVVAHATFRNVFLVTTLHNVRKDLCLLWPEPLALDDVTFVDAKTGAPLGDAEKRTTMRALLDGEVGVRVVRGTEVPMLDPTGCATSSGGVMGWLFGDMSPLSLIHI